MTRKGGRRTDSNHTPIVRALRALGYSVQDLSLVGGGCPDIMVGVTMRMRFGASDKFLLIPVNLVFEIKVDEKSVQKRKAEIAKPISPEDGVQVLWHKRWEGQKEIVSSHQEIVKIIKAYEEMDFRDLEIEQGFG